MAKVKSGRGRPADTELVKAQRESVVAQKKLEEAQQTLEDEMFLDGDPESDRAKKEVAAARKSVFEKIEPLNIAISKYRAAGRLNSKECVALKNERKKFYEEINELPDLGMTFDEWDQLPDHMKMKAAGRPGMTPELMTVRCEINLAEAEKKRAEIEKKEGVKHQTISALVKANPKWASKAGRPKRTPLDEFDAEKNRYERMISEIRNGNERNRKPASYTENGKLRGRKAQDDANKIAELEEKLRLVNLKIEKEEAKLDEVGLIDREIKGLRKQSTAIKKGLQDKGIDLTDPSIVDIREGGIWVYLNRKIDLLYEKRAELKGEDGSTRPSALPLELRVSTRQIGQRPESIQKLQTAILEAAKVMGSISISGVGRLLNSEYHCYGRPAIMKEAENLAEEKKLVRVFFGKGERYRHFQVSEEEAKKLTSEQAVAAKEVTSEGFKVQGNNLAVTQTEAAQLLRDRLKKMDLLIEEPKIEDLLAS